MRHIWVKWATRLGTFGKKAWSQVQNYEKTIYLIHNRGLPKYITKSLAKSVLKLSEKKLRAMLAGKLTDEEIDAAVANLAAAKDAIRDGTITLLSNTKSAWNGILGDKALNKNTSYLY